MQQLQPHFNFSISQTYTHNIVIPLSHSDTHLLYTFSPFFSQSSYGKNSLLQSRGTQKRCMDSSRRSETHCLHSESWHWKLAYLASESWSVFQLNHLTLVCFRFNYYMITLNSSIVHGYCCIIVVDLDLYLGK